ncbi:alpha/beta hydrolase fold-domain-containing protein [Cunninghamella echinulata]|nr:alpha/beta hydrolase fold-domain-containing protein [Cunninghamella echinulata]
MTTSKKAPAHPTYDAVFKLLSAGPNWHDLEPVDLRALIDSRPAPPGVVVPETHVEEKEIAIDLQDTDGQQTSSNIKLTISRPLGTEKQTLPAFIYLHGGGFVFGTFKSSEKFIKDLTVRANVAVIFVDYTLSPEVHFPVAPEECYSSILWIHQHASELNIDPSKLVVGGDSAGGNLSAVSSILLKKRGHSDILKGQVLMYPTVALTAEGYESRELYGDGDYLLSNKDMVYFKKSYLGSNYGKGIEDVRLSPIIATDEELNGLPRALVITAECDVLRDEGEAYSRRLLKAGVKTTSMRSLGAMHGFITMPLDTENYIHSIQSISNFIHDSI